jgi:hypothetical protein
MDEFLFNNRSKNDDKNSNNWTSKSCHSRLNNNLNSSLNNVISSQPNILHSIIFDVNSNVNNNSYSNNGGIECESVSKKKKQCVRLVCNECHDCKRGCDKVKPICGRCKKLDRNCVWPGELPSDHKQPHNDSLLHLNVSTQSNQTKLNNAMFNDLNKSLHSSPDFSGMDFIELPRLHQALRNSSPTHKLKRSHSAIESNDEISPFEYNKYYNINNDTISLDNQDATSETKFSIATTASDTTTVYPSPNLLVNAPKLSPALLIDNTTVKNSSAAIQITAAIQIICDASNSLRNWSYIKTFFSIISNLFLPVLDETAFYREAHARQIFSAATPNFDSTIADSRSIVNIINSDEDATGWFLQYYAALAMGARLNTDIKYAELCALAAHFAGTQCLSLPHPNLAKCYRGLVILGMYCLGTNDLTSSRCYLTVSRKLFGINDVQTAVEPAVFTCAEICENALKTFELLGAAASKPQAETANVYKVQGYRLQQLQLFPNDYAKYLNFTKVFNIDYNSLEYENFAKLFPDILANNAIYQTDLDIRNLRGELIGALRLITEVGADFESPPTCSLYSLLIVMLKAEASSVIEGTTRIRIINLKCTVYHMLGEIEKGLLDSRFMLELATEQVAQKGTRQNPFQGLFSPYAALKMLVNHDTSKDTCDYVCTGIHLFQDYVQTWPFCLPLLQGLLQDIRVKYPILYQELATNPPTISDVTKRILEIRSATNSLMNNQKNLLNSCDSMLQMESVNDEFINTLHVTTDPLSLPATKNRATLQQALAANQIPNPDNVTDSKLPGNVVF